MFAYTVLMWYNMNMRLYHGSNIKVTEPHVFQSDRKLDFGTGFYLTSSLEQASRWASLTTQRRGNGKSIISVFEADETFLSRLKILKFDKAGIDWLKFIAANRKGISVSDGYDIIIGPVANDKTMPVLSLYFAGFYSEEEAIKRLLPQKLYNQFTFKTETALKALTLIEVME